MLSCSWSIVCVIEFVRKAGPSSIPSTADSLRGLSGLRAHLYRRDRQRRWFGWEIAADAHHEGLTTDAQQLRKEPRTVPLWSQSHAGSGKRVPRAFSQSIQLNCQLKVQ